MSIVDWRELYRQNQATIANAGIPPAAIRPGQGPAPTRRAPTGDDALIHVPADLDRSLPAPVVFMLHGCNQAPDAFAAATAMNTIADRHGFVVVYPRQPRQHNPQGCWNWFLPEHQQRDAGEPARIANLARHLVAGESEQALDPARIFIAGLSSGGAMALILAACYPDMFAAVAVHSGLPYGCARDLPSALAAMSHPGTAPPAPDALPAAMGEHARPIPSLVIHGTADTTVAAQNAHHVLAQSMHANHLIAPDTCPHPTATPSVTQERRAPGGLLYRHREWSDSHGALTHQFIEVHDLGHAWSGGRSGGSYTDPRGPSASEAIWAFFARTARRARP